MATNPILEGYYVVEGQNAYSTLIQQPIFNTTNNFFILNTPYCIQKISLPNTSNIDFWLELSGFTFPNFTYDATTKTSYFDVNDYKDIIPHTGDQIYLDNQTKFPRILIKYPKNKPINYPNNTVQINIQGFQQMPDGSNIPINTNITKYLTTYSLNINAPTDSIDFYGKIGNFYTSNPSNTSGKITISLNNSIYSSLDIDTTYNNKLIRFKMDNSSGTFPNGNENNYLSTDINTHTINMTQIQYIDVEYQNFTTSNINQNVYIAYNYPDRSRIFNY